MFHGSGFTLGFLPSQHQFASTIQSQPKNALGILVKCREFHAVGVGWDCPFFHDFSMVLSLAASGSPQVHLQ